MSGLEAAVFDLDGVVTFTERLHAAAWKDLFDALLRARAEHEALPFRPFTEADYLAFVDGRPRLEGIRTFLDSRGITLPETLPREQQGSASVATLATRKNALFRALLQREGVEVDADAVDLIHALKARGVRVGVASSSENTPLVLARAGLDDLFDARIDGIESVRLGLKGKPEPDIFLACLERLGTSDPSHALVVEDATVGVEAGRRGGFGLVIGVDRDAHSEALREHGADWVIRSFREISVEQIELYFARRGTPVKPG